MQSIAAEHLDELMLLTLLKGGADASMEQILDHVYRFKDTCNVYVVRSGAAAVLIDFGSGDVLSHLSDIGVEHVSAVLMTHHHRDQGQGLQRAVDAGIPIFVPHSEQDLFQAVDAHWQGRAVANNYNLRQDRFSLLEPVAIAGTLEDYTRYTIADLHFTVVPTPGHTVGSLSLFVEIDDTRVAFTGDLIAAPGKVWSMAATQWTYNGAEGVAASVLSLLDVKDRQPDILLPSHGDPMHHPERAIDLLVKRFRELLQLRGHHVSLLDVRETPYVPVTPHLLRHRQSVANSFVLLSERGTAMMIDFGYDMDTGLAAGLDRAARRPWLYSLPALKRQFGIDRIDVVMPTHFHDDHVAGFNLLQRVEGAQVWVPEFFADILEHPSDYDLPCLWYDPIAVDKRLPLETSIEWEEYTLTLYALPGHTRYAVAIALEVDGYKVLVTGDQYQGGAGLELNYVYANRFEASDYVKSAALFRRLQPDIILSGHWKPLWVTPEYLDQIEARGAELERLHHALETDSPYLGDEGFVARITPYQSRGHGEAPVEFTVELHNPYVYAVETSVNVVTPPGWQVVDAAMPGEPIVLDRGGTIMFCMNPSAMHMLRFQLLPPPDFSARRERIAVDVTIDGHRFGQQAEALISAGRVPQPSESHHAVTTVGR